MRIMLRAATLDDAERLLSWRNDPVTRKASHNTSIIAYETHVTWLSTVLANPRRHLYIAERDGVPVGTIRADQEDDGFELSWTVAPEWRGNGCGKAMVQATVELLGAPVRAEIKRGNSASIRIAQHVGMTLERASGDVLYYRLH